MTKRPTAEEVAQAKDSLAKYRSFPADYDYPEEIDVILAELAAVTEERDAAMRPDAELVDALEAAREHLAEAQEAIRELGSRVNRDALVTYTKELVWDQAMSVANTLQRVLFHSPSKRGLELTLWLELPAVKAAMEVSDANTN